MYGWTLQGENSFTKFLHCLGFIFSQCIKLKNNNNKVNGVGESLANVKEGDFEF